MPRKPKVLAATTRVRAATTADLPALAASLGQRSFFDERIGRQRDGRGILLVAWQGNTAVGDVYVWLEPADEPELRERLPGVPLLQHLEVRQDLRGQQVGTTLIEAAERMLRSRGYSQVALGVTLDNHRAVRLYHRQGYREWPYLPITTVSQEFLRTGPGRERAELCQVLVKNLAGPGR